MSSTTGPTTSRIRTGLCLALGWMLSAVGAEPEPASAPSPWLLEARTAQAKGLVLRAVEMAGKAVRETPKDPRAWYFRATLLENSQQWEAAEADLGKVLELAPDDAVVAKQRGILRLRLGAIDGAISDFDRYAARRPERLAELWQRGIALYYARRFEEGRKQFELHRTVNPQDVENSAWHFACVARLEGFDKARERVLPVEGDTRVPMREIQALLEGKAAPEEVEKAADRVEAPQRREEARFYARLYLGLFEEARGRLDLAAKHLAEATRGSEQFGIMGVVAQLHADWLGRELRRKR